MPHRLALGLALLLALTACAPRTATSSDVGADAQPAGNRLTVVATAFPLAWVAEQVAPEAEVTLLASGGQDPHDLELSPSERALLESADVVLYLGDIGFQPQIEAAVPAADGVAIAVADLVDGAMLELDEHGHDDDHDHGEEEHGHGDDSGHDDEHGHDDDHDGGIDPHIWFDAAAMARVAEEVGATFAALDEGGAEAHRQAAGVLSDELTALDAEVDELLAGCTHDTVIVSHEAYAYLLEPRGFTQEGISGTGGHGEASPQRLAELTERIRAEGIPAVAAEPVEGRADAEALAAEAGVDLVEVDPLEVADEGTSAGYPELLREQAEAFARALSCG